MTDADSTRVRTDSASPRKTVYLVQVMRGIAAAAVAVYHTHLILAKPEYGSLHMFEAVAARGWVGVNFFFVLSGFIIMLAHHNDVGRPKQVGRYLWRRFVRVYPIYWVFTTAYVVAALLGIGYPDFRWTSANMISSYTLLPFDPEPLPPLQVAWTLFYEITFYAFFLLLILHRRLGIAAFALWTVAILVYALLLGRTAMGPLNMWNIYFIVGMGTYFVYRSVAGHWAWPFLAVGIALILGLLAWDIVPPRIVTAQGSPLMLLGLAIPFALILAGGALLERNRTIYIPPILRLLGDASFSLYLVHSPALSSIAELNQRFIPGILPDWLLFVGAATASLAIGIAAHMLVERPLLRLINHRVPHRGVGIKPAEAR